MNAISAANGALLLATCLLLACASGGLRSGASSPDSIAVGVAQVDITPVEPIRLTGYGNRSSPSERVAQRLRATALAFGRDDEGPAVLIAANVIGVSRQITQEIARRLEKLGVKRDHLAISATHTHTGPALAGTLPYIFSVPVTAEQQAVIDRYSALLVDKLEQVAVTALAGRRPSRVAWGHGTASFAANRRVVKDGKWVAFGIAPTGPVDHDLPLISVRDTDGTLRAVLVSYACHATTLEAKENVIHGDWPGTVQEMIAERHPGVLAMITIGAGADANPNPRGGGLPDVERHAREVADEVDRLLGTGLRAIKVPPAAAFRWLDLSFAPLPSRAEWEERAKQTGANGFYARSMLDRLDRGGQIATAVSYPVQVWTFGNDLAMVFLGGEVVADYGLRLKRELDATRLWVNAYSNDVAFYVPSRRMIPEGGYEVVGSMVYYGHPAALAEGTEDQIVRAVDELVPERFKR